MGREKPRPIVNVALAQKIESWRFPSALIFLELGDPDKSQCVVCYRVRELCEHGYCQGRLCRWMHYQPSVFAKPNIEGTI